MMIRPQQQQVKRHQALIDALEVGDDVVTSSGIYGTVTDLDEETVDIEIADGVEVTMSRRAVMEVAVHETAEPTDSGDDVEAEDDPGPSTDESGSAETDA
jgi:preprotein translocase subunit YajC